MGSLVGLSSWFITVFSYLVTYMSEENDPSYLHQFHFDDPVLQDNYDFIIIGAGSAGSVVANRLSEVEGWSILLVEAGGEEDLVSDTPGLALNLWNTDMDWNYTTVEQEHACRDTKGICLYPRGHVLGGSSTLYFLNYVRGNRMDFDKWKEEGNEGWGYDDVLPYFLKSEDMRIKSLFKSPYHSTGGYLTVESSPYTSEIQSHLIQAGNELGFEMTDFNGEIQTGLGYPQLNMRDGSRCSSAKAFLSVIKKKKNVAILKRTVALKIELNENNDRAEGVTLMRDNSIFTIKANKEIIVSAGAINTPKLLMHSGIGPRAHLEEMYIKPKIDLPVGLNLVDHAYVNLLFKINQSITITRDKVENIETIMHYAKSRTGYLTSIIGIQLVGHLTYNKLFNPLPDFQTFMCDFFSFAYDDPVLLMTVTKLRPESRGSVKLKSCDPKDPPLIDPRFFENPKDFRDSVKGCMVILEFMSAQAMSHYEPRVYTPEGNCAGLEGEEYCKCAVKYFSKTMYHPTGTARMSPNSTEGVVSPSLNVWGVNNLRVIDASVMPSITSGNTNAPTVMIGEKGADIIKKEWKSEDLQGN